MRRQSTRISQKKLAIPEASDNHPNRPPVLILIDVPFPSRLSRYTKAQKLANLMDEAEPDVLAYMTFPREHRTKLHSGVAPVSWMVTDLGEQGVAGSFRS